MFNTRTFDLNLLRMFDAIVQEKTISSAARELGVSQSAVSNALARMRYLTGDRLFVPTRAGMQPTPFAVRIINPLHDALTAIWQSFEEGSEFSPETSTRTFSIVIPDLAQAVVLPRLMPKLDKGAPRICIRVLQIERDQFRHVLESGTADLIISNFPPRARAFRKVRLLTSSWRLVFRAGHPVLDRGSRATRVKLEDYLAVPHAAVRPPASAVEFDRFLIGKKLDRRIVLEVPSYLVLFEVVASSNVVAVVPETMVRRLLRDPGVKSSKLPMNVPSSDIYEFWHARQDADEGHRWLRETIAGLFRPRNSHE